MTNLSPAAQAVLDASRQYATHAWSEATHQRFNLGIAAALRAAADQICMKQPLGGTDADAGVFAAHHAISTSLLAIADELEANEPNL
jgi:hypothetical protein